MPDYPVGNGGAMVTFYGDVLDMQDLREIAKEDDVSLSAIIRKAIRAYLKAR